MTTRRNLVRTEALAALIEKHNAQLRGFPAEVVSAARKVSVDVLADLAARSDMARKVHDSYAAFRDRTAAWAQVSIKGVLEARGRGRAACHLLTVTRCSPCGVVKLR